MNFYEIFWIGIVLFSTLSFIYLSAMVLYKGLPELKTMFAELKREKE